mmetsp:Transcript_25046/g.61770  ORF Transcript_25046/g.61770 Transcript_25046/m.61770 type:complete len:131 (+) Transcript_25046:1663-2055(+)
MLRRGALIYTAIIALCLTVAPALLISIGIASFRAFGIPVCGAVGQLEVLDGMRCGTRVAWECYVGIASLLLCLVLATANLRNLLSKAAAGRKRLQKLLAKQTTAALGAATGGGGGGGGGAGAGVGDDNNA